MSFTTFAHRILLYKEVICALILYYICGSSSSDSSNQKSSVARKSSQVPNGPSESHTRYSDDAVSNAIDRQGSTEEKQGVSPNAALQSQPVKPSNVHQNSVTVASASSAVGVYSSSTDPVHVPSPDSRSSGAVGAIGREVGVVGVRRHSSDNSLKQSSVPSSSYANSIVGKDGTSTNSFQSFNTLSKTEKFSETNVTEPSFPDMPVSRSFLNNQYNNRQHQQSVGHQRGIFLFGAAILWCTFFYDFYFYFLQ